MTESTLLRRLMDHAVRRLQRRADELELGPAWLFWSAMGFSGLCVLISVYALNEAGDQATYVVIFFVSLGALVGLGPAPVWATRGVLTAHRERSRRLAERLEPLRQRLENRFLAGDDDEESFRQRYQELQDLARGKDPDLVKLAAGRWLKAVATAYLVLAALLAAAFGYGAIVAFQDAQADEQDSQSYRRLGNIMLSIATTVPIVPAAVAVPMLLAGAASYRRGWKQIHARLDAMDASHVDTIIAQRKGAPS